MGTNGRQLFNDDWRIGVGRWNCKGKWRASGIVFGSDGGAYLAHDQDVYPAKRLASVTTTNKIVVFANTCRDSQTACRVCVGGPSNCIA